jgi:hypothetical protein
MQKDTNPKDVIGTKKWRQFMVVPRQVLWEVAVGMLEGALKYGRHNYRASGVRASVYVDAAIGHLDQFIEGEDIDKDSGLSHVTKAICSLVVLRDAMLNDFWVDDRPPKIKDIDALRDRLQALVEENFTRHADKSPHHYTELEDGSLVYRVEAQQSKPFLSQHSIDLWNKKAMRDFEEMRRGSEHVIGEPVTSGPLTPEDYKAMRDLDEAKETVRELESRELEIGKFYKAVRLPNGEPITSEDVPVWKIVNRCKIEDRPMGVRKFWSISHPGIRLSSMHKWIEVSGWDE